MEETRILVMGIGGAGGNAVNRMIEANLKGVDFLVANTDNQDLHDKSKANQKIHLGPSICSGRGAGAEPEIGQKAAKESLDALRPYFEGVDMLFITAGMGGGTGTGAAPVIAELAKSLGVLVVGIVSKPFDYEGKRKLDVAEKGIQELIKHVNTLITIPNQRLFEIDRSLSIKEAFRMADDVLRQAVQGISDLITSAGLINLDFADVKTVMSIPGGALMGVGHGSGENKEVTAAREAIKFPLLENATIRGAKGVLVNIRCNDTIGLEQVDKMTRIITEDVSEEANIIHGTVIDNSLEDEVFVTVICTGYDKEAYSSSLREGVTMRGGTKIAPASLAGGGTGTEPKKEVIHTFNALPRRMSKELGSVFGDQSENEYDVPAYLRRNKAKAAEKN